MSANRQAMRNRIRFVSLLAVVVGVVCYFAFRRQVVSSLHEIGALPKGYDGWLAHVEAKISTSPEKVNGDGTSCYFCFAIDVDWDDVRRTAVVHEKAMSNSGLVAFLGSARGSAILLRMTMSSKHSDVEGLAKSLVDAGHGEHLFPVLEGESLKNVHSVKLGGKFLRAVVFDKPREPTRRRVATLHEIGALPKGYDGWLAHVQAELLAVGEERPPDPKYPPGGPIRTPFIVDVLADGSISLNNTARTLPELVAVTKLSFDGQSDPDPIDFRIAIDARIASVEPVATAIVAAGFGDSLRPLLYGSEFARVYSIKLGGRFLRVVVNEVESESPKTPPR
jgi:hypothetical protein